jgi:hypothetical protein
MAKKKRSKIKVFYPRRKVVTPTPDCPHCGKGVLEPREYVEIATENYDQETSPCLYCPKCEWIL